MNICLFTASFLPKVAGMEIVIDRLAREYIAMGHRVAVLAKTPRDMKEAPAFDYPVCYYKRSMSEVWFNGAPKRMLTRLHRQYRFDVIHAHQIYPTGYLGWKMSGKLGIPTVMTSHVGDVREGSRLRKKPVTNRRMIEAMTSGSAVTGVGRGVCDTIDAMVGFRRAFYIGNGADIPLPPPEPPSLAGRLPVPAAERGFDLTLCRLHANKGLTCLVDALGILKQRRVGRPPRHTVEGGDERRTVAVDGGHVGDLGGQAAVNPYRAAAVLVHDGHLRAVSESAFAAAFQADDLFDERSCADVVVADAGVADAHARCEPDTAAQPCAAQLRGVEVLRHLDRRPVVGRRAGGFERSDFAGGQSSVCVHSRHISNLQI